MSMSRPATPVPPAGAQSARGAPEPGRPAGPVVDQAKLDAFLGKVVADWGATASAALGEPFDRPGVGALLEGLGAFAGLEAWWVAAEVAAATGVEGFWPVAEAHAARLVAAAGLRGDAAGRAIRARLDGIRAHPQPA